LSLKLQNYDLFDDLWAAVGILSPAKT
jgi:hypothetical protein